MTSPMAKKKTMSRTLRIAGGLFLLPVLFSLSACIVAYEPYPHEAMRFDGGPAPGEVVVDQAPPALPVEVVTVAPAPGLVWVGGYWGWSSGRYVWVSGGWHNPPRAGAVWVGGSWSRRPSGGHVWVQGRWR